jgi:hypothetical protein
LAACSSIIVILNNAAVEKLSIRVLSNMAMVLEQTANPASSDWRFWILACRLVEPL